MTPTTLVALRRLLFFTTQEAALFVAASSERPQGVSDQQWRQWEDGEQPIPADLARRITELVDWRSTALAATADTIRQQIKDKGVPEAVFIIWYERLDDWKSLPNREPLMWRLQQAVCAALAGMFSTVRLVAFDAAAYTGWLAGRDDSESMRAQWASASQA
ncbi:MAG: hypothetical protein H6R17_2098 [Proteobacteria bacterium]|nr:hypothetical protein [Pseudomonadota bacterium]